MTVLEDVQACEERLVNVWPAVDTLLMGDWMVRFAHGYSARANSASAIRAGAQLDDDTISRIVALYRDAGLMPSIRLTLLCESGLEQRLKDGGWERRVTSIGMITSASAAASASPALAPVELVTSVSQRWLDEVSLRQESASKRDPGHLRAIVGRIKVPVTFATVREQGQPVAFGMSAVDRGLAEIGSILVDDGHRGKGFGRILMQSLMGWAQAQGATRIFLQVESSNQVAMALYRSLGFEELYTYRQYILR